MAVSPPTRSLPACNVVTAEATGFKQETRDATIEAGTITTVNFVLEPGKVSEMMTVSGAVPLLRYDQHQVSE